MQNDKAIVVKNLRKSYGKLEVLKGVNFTVRRGSVLALLGPNGAGKTTTVKILSTLLLPNKGQALVNGYDVVKQDAQVRHSIGLTGQYAAVDEYLSGEENLHMIGRLYRMNLADVKQRTVELLEHFDLTKAAKRPVRTYSGGMRRKLDLAMSLIASPPIIFLDEPTTGLDPRSRITMWAIIKKLVKDGKTILLTTQQMEEADNLADEIVVIDDGRVIASGNPTQLKRKVGSDRLEIIVSPKSNFDTAKKALGTKKVQTNEESRTLSVSAKSGVQDLKNALSQLEKANIVVESIELRRPTLDDVFLSLTGHSASPKTNKNNQWRQNK